MKTIYISGKITGLENEAEKLFENAESQLLIDGYNVVNPMTIKHDHDQSWLNFMRVDIKALMDCDCIFMLCNWQQSRGAKIEFQLAKDLGIEIIFESQV